MGEGLMQGVRYLDFNTRHFAEFEQLAYRAIFERGFVDVDFNKQHWNQHIKNLVSLNSNIVRLLFANDTMIGFYIIQLHTLPWNHRTQALFQLMHLQAEFRNPKIYTSMFRDAEALCLANGVEKIQTTDTAIQMDEGQKLTLLHNHNYHHVDAVWEAKKDV
jgi:hypothetical protein